MGAMKKETESGSGFSSSVYLEEAAAGFGSGHTFKPQPFDVKKRSSRDGGGDQKTMWCSHCGGSRFS